MHGTPPDLNQTGYCPSCGHDQRGTLAAGERRCAECGLRYDPLDLLIASPPSNVALRVLLLTIAAIQPRTSLDWIASGIGAAVYLFAIVALCMPSLGRARSCGYPSTPQSQLQLLQEIASIFPEYQSGEYPIHISRLLEDGPWLLDSCFDSQAGTGQPPFIVGSLNVAEYDGSPTAARALDEAIVGLDPALQWYRFGDFWFTRLDRPRDDRRIIFAWSLVQKDGERWVVFDDGYLEPVMPERWPSLWLMDGYARLAHGLDPIHPPPWPGGS